LLINLRVEFDVIDFGDVVVRKLPLDVKDVSSCESSISEDFRESMIQKVSKDNVLMHFILVLIH
jgi:hypothetical protein